MVGVTATPTDARSSKPVADGRRAFWKAGLIMTVGIVALIVLFVLLSPSPGPGLTQQQEINKLQTQAPQIIPNPDEREKATNPGDPGGWEQVMLLGVMVTGMVTVGGLAYRASRKAKRRATAADTA